MKLKTFLLSVILIFVRLSAVAQAEEKILNIDYGGSVYFSFNSLPKYTNGITYTDYTQLSVKYTDTTDTGATDGNGWMLTVKPAAAITGSSENLAYNVLKLVVTYNSTTTEYLMDGSEITIAEGNAEDPPTSKHLILIGFETGTDNSVEGYTPDYYYVDLVFWLKKRP